MIRVFYLIVLFCCSVSHSNTPLDSAYQSRYTASFSDSVFELHDLVRGPEIQFSLALPQTIEQELVNQLNAYAEFLRRHQEYVWLITLHTDTRGNAGQNHQLSMARAQQLSSILTDTYGITSGTFWILGKGEYEPLIPESVINSFKDDQSQFEYYHQLNRRIELRVIGDSIRAERCFEYIDSRGKIDLDSIIRHHYSKDLFSQSFEVNDLIRLPTFCFDPGNGYHFFYSDYAFSALQNFLHQNPLLLCELWVHTDTRGSADSNQKISLYRAQRIREYFIQNFGSDTLFEERLVPVGKGESTPIVQESFVEQFKSDKETYEGLHAVNRRYELKVKGFLGQNYYTNSLPARKDFSSEQMREPAYYEELIRWADRALLEGRLDEAFKYYSIAAELAPVDETYAGEQRDKVAELLQKN